MYEFKFKISFSIRYFFTAILASNFLKFHLMAFIFRVRGHFWSHTYANKSPGDRRTLTFIYKLKFKIAAIPK